MYSKYGKCKTRKSSKAESDKSDKSDKTDKTGKSDKSAELAESSKSENKPGTTDDPMVNNEDEKPKSDVVDGEGGNEDEDENENDEGQYRKGSSQTRDADEAGFPNANEADSDDVDNDDTTKSSDERYAEAENDSEGDESGSGADDGEGFEDDDAKESNDEASEDSEMVGEESTDDGAGKKKGKKVKTVMEYDIKDMYPEINILIQKKKREWDFQDPDIIRALWLETKTLALAEWKVRNAKISIEKPSFEVKETVTVTLRQEHLRNKAELQQALQERDFEMTETSRDPPHFDTIQLATNLTTDMRYKYNRNNPPVPSHYIEHFEKFKKPPFKNNPIWYVHS